MIAHLPDCEGSTLYRCSLCGAVGDYDFGRYVTTEDCPYYCYACPECRRADGIAVAPEEVQRRLYDSDGDGVSPRIDIYAGDILSMFAESGLVEFDEDGNITPDSPMSEKDMRELEERLLDLKALPSAPEDPPPGPDYDLFPC